MKKEYNFNYYLHKAAVCFVVDTEKFTEEMAKSTLTFFVWDYDDEADPVDEVMKKYAIEAIKIATFNNYNAYGVKSEFENNEGFCRVDGSYGITLTSVTAFEFEDSDLEVKITDKN